MKALIAVVLLCGFAGAQNNEEHRFFDKPARFALTGSAAIFAADAIQSCHGLAQGYRESWLPTQNCGGVSLWMAGNFAQQLGASYLLHRTRHHRLERIAEFAGAVGSVAGIVFSAYKIKTFRQPALNTIPVRDGHILGVCVVGQTC